MKVCLSTFLLDACNLLPSNQGAVLQGFQVYGDKYAGLGCRFSKILVY